MKKLYKVLLIVGVILAIVAGFSVRNLANAKTYDTKAISQELSDALQNWIVTNYSRYYKNIGVSIVPEDKVTIKNGVASEVFNTKIDLTLKAESVKDLPFMKGMLNYFNSKKATATKAQIEAANKLIDDWDLELKDYIGKPEPTANATYKIVAKITNNGIEKSTVRLYIEEPSESGPGDAFYPVPPSIFESPEKEEKLGEEAVKDEMNMAVKHNPLLKNDTDSSYPYNRIAARDYANRYTSECQSGGKNTNYWNNNQYKLSVYFASDCADYVSQALYAGGIPMDSIHDKSHWWYDNSEPINSYNYCPWVYVSSLKNYMIDNGYWYKRSTDNYENYYWTNAGNVIVIPNYHTMVIVLNDTHTRRFSAHTTDRKEHIYYYHSDWEYYTVQNPNIH